MANLQEKILITNLKKGDVNAFEKLFDAYYPKLVNFALKFQSSPDEAENIAQDVFVKIWEQREQLKEEYSFSSLLFKISKNQILNLFRKNVNEKKYLEYLTLSEDEGTNTVLQQVTYNELQNNLEKYISKLPARRKKIFNLSRKEGLTYKEIAQRLSISENTVDTQIRNALNDLKKQIKKNYPALINFIMTILFIK